MTKEAKQFDPKEFDLPETHFVRDVENRVFQGIVLQVLAKVDDISLVEGSFIDHFLGRDNLEGLRGISIEQDSKKQCVSVRVEINIRYGVSIPEKAEEIQAMVAEEITNLTGLHVSSVHVVFKGIVSEDHLTRVSDFIAHANAQPIAVLSETEEEYTDEF